MCHCPLATHTSSLGESSQESTRAIQSRLCSLRMLKSKADGGMKFEDFLKQGVLEWVLRPIACMYALSSISSMSSLRCAASCHVCPLESLVYQDRREHKMTITCDACHENPMNNAQISMTLEASEPNNRFDLAQVVTHYLLRTPR